MEQAIEPFSRALRRVIAQGRVAVPDIIHSHHWFSGVAALPVARDLGIGHVQSFHSVAAPADARSLAAGEPSESTGRIEGERRVAQDSDLVAAVSDAEAETVRRRYGLSRARIRVVRPGVGIEFFCPRTCPPAASPYLLFAARLQPLKGADLALRTFALVHEQRPDLRLLIAGAASDDFGDYPDKLVATAHALGVSDAVEFLGPCSRKKLACLMRSAELFLLPSWSETFGLVALESQASGVPVVGWDGAGGLAEAIAPTGTLLSSREPSTWASAVLEFLDDPERLADARADARDFASKHTWQHTAEELLAVYEEVLS